MLFLAGVFFFNDWVSISLKCFLGHHLSYSYEIFSHNFLLFIILFSILVGTQVRSIHAGNVDVPDFSYYR